LQKQVYLITVPLCAHYPIIRHVASLALDLQHAVRQGDLILSQKALLLFRDEKNDKVCVAGCYDTLCNSLKALVAPYFGQLLSVVFPSGNDFI
jgi:hypothetical protein